MTTIAYGNVGASGAIFIDDDGVNVRGYVRQSDGQTYINSPGKDWAFTVNGQTFTGKWTWPKGAGDRLIAGAFGVSGSQTVSFSIGATGTQGFGSGGGVSGWASRATVPPAPSNGAGSLITPTSFRQTFYGNGDGGSGITTWQAIIAEDANFSIGVQIVNTGQSGIVDWSGRIPGKTYWTAARGVNGVGTGPWSNAVSVTTLPATAPGLIVEPGLAGTAASATLTPPGGATGVTKYTVQRRLVGGTTVTTTEGATSPVAQTGLTPGQSYEYRASAWFGTYQSPWTDWVIAVQPNPNTDPGSYFDGNTAQTPALQYGWLGTAGKSASTAIGQHPLGWRTFAQAASTSGGIGAVYRSVGGFQGQFAARALFHTDATAAGFIFGTADAPTTMLADIEGDAPYFGSVYAMPSRKQRVRLGIRWFNAAGTYLSTTLGDETVIQPGQYTRLVASAMAPAAAQWAAVVVIDVAGTDWSLWRGGDWLQLDGAMVTLSSLFPYFDGATPDTSQYAYSWLGVANASASQRETLPESAGVDPLLDPDCPPIPSAPLPPDIIDGCIDEVGTWRRYWAVIPENEVYDWIDEVPTVWITSGAAAARQVRVRWYPNPDELDPTQANDLPFDSEQIITYMPPRTVMTLDAVSETVWASVDGGPERNADDKLRGSGGLPATWPVLSCGSSYLVSFDVPLDAPIGNIQLGAGLTTRRM